MSTVIQLLLDKEGFPSNHLPVLVVRQNDVKFFFFFDCSALIAATVDRDRGAVWTVGRYLLSGKYNLFVCVQRDQHGQRNKA